MTVLARLLATDPAWLRPDGSDGIVICSRVRLARNLADEPFPARLPTARARTVVARLIRIIPECLDWEQPLVTEHGDLDADERHFLLERRLVSPEFCRRDTPAAVVARNDGGAALMINEEDHLRLQTLRPGLRLREALDDAVAIDRRLEDALPWASDPRYGYLAACPTNAGTGLRASAMLHLPALAQTEELPRALRAVGKLHLAVRGLHGEGSEPIGHYHQVSNQRTMGCSEVETMESLLTLIGDLVRYEQLAREHLVQHKRDVVEDKVFRALGVLRYARRLSTQELIEQAAWLRLGAAIGLCSEPGLHRLDRTVLRGHPGHLALHGLGSTDSDQRDRARADLVRRELFPAP